MKKFAIFRNADKKTIIWVVALALVCVACAAVWLLTAALGVAGEASIRVDGEELYHINLATVREEYDIDIDTSYGHNTVHVAPGAISVISSNCPDGICVAQGAITQSGVPIICMPHHLTVRIEGGGIDG